MSYKLRMSKTVPWSCPKCGAIAYRPCFTNPGCKTTHLPQIHIARYNIRPQPPQESK